MNAASTQRGRVLLYVAVILLILERLIIAGYALAAYNRSEINWTSVLLPLTHIAVVVFLLVTYDMLIYWLVVMWSCITTGIYVYKFNLMFSQLPPEERVNFFTRWMPSWWIVESLMVFHLIIAIMLVLPSVRAYLAQQRSKLDFVDLPEDKQ